MLTVGKTKSTLGVRSQQLGARISANSRESSAGRLRKPIWQPDNTTTDTEEMGDNRDTNHTISGVTLHSGHDSPYDSGER
jgi:hypothetical protein